MHPSSRASVSMIGFLETCTDETAETVCACSATLSDVEQGVRCVEELAVGQVSLHEIKFSWAGGL